MALEENVAHANRKCIVRIPEVINNRLMIISETDFLSCDTISICMIGAIVAVGIRIITTTGVVSILHSISACVAQVCLRRTLDEYQRPGFETPQHCLQGCALLARL